MKIMKALDLTLMVSFLALTVWGCGSDRDTAGQPSTIHDESTSASVVSQETISAADKAFKKAYRLYESGKYGAARNAFTSILSNYPGTSAYPSSLVHLANIQYVTDKYHLAVNHVDELLEKYPDHDGVPRALLIKGYILFESRRNYDEVSGLFQRIVIEYPESGDAPAALLALAEVSELRGEYLRALNLYGAILSDYPCSPLAKNAVSRIDSISIRHFNDYFQDIPKNPIDQDIPEEDYDRCIPDDPLIPDIERG